MDGCNVTTCSKANKCIKTLALYTVASSSASYSVKLECNATRIINEREHNTVSVRPVFDLYCTLELCLKALLCIMQGFSSSNDGWVDKYTSNACNIILKRMMMMQLLAAAVYRFVWREEGLMRCSLRSRGRGGSRWRARKGLLVVVVVVVVLSAADADSSYRRSFERRRPAILRPASTLRVSASPLMTPSVHPQTQTPTLTLGRLNRSRQPRGGQSNVTNK
jgi:hypothetical protein